MFSNQGNKPQGNIFSGNAGQNNSSSGGSSNIFSGQTTVNAGQNLFGGPGNSAQTGQPAQTGQTNTGIFGGATSNKPNNGIFSGGNQPSTGLTGNTANTSTTPTGSNNLFGNNTAQNKPLGTGGLFGNSQPAGQVNQPPPTGQNSTGITGISGNAGNTGIAGNTGATVQANTGGNLFNKPSTGGGLLGNTAQGQQNTGGQQAQGGLFNASSGNAGGSGGTMMFSQNPASNNVSIVNNPAQNPAVIGATNTFATGATSNQAGGMYSKPPISVQNLPAATTTNTVNTANTAGNLLGGNKPAANPFNLGGATTQNAPAGTVQQNQTGGQTATGGNLFANLPAANNTGTAGTTGNTGGTGATGATGATSGQNPFTGQGQPGQGQPGQGQPALGNPTIVQPQDDIEAEFDKSNKTVAEFITDCRTSFITAYEDLQKLCDSTLRYLSQREQNQKIAKNFAALEPHISNKSQYVLRTLEGMEKQQDEIERAIDMMSKKLGEGKYTHELSEHLEEYEVMKEEIMKLQQNSEQWNDPASEQLVNIFENLNQIETQIKEMDQIADVYMHSFGFN